MCVIKLEPGDVEKPYTSTVFHRFAIEKGIFFELLKITNSNNKWQYQNIEHLRP